jgi:ketosteroid isomerase-like protein
MSQENVEMVLRAFDAFNHGDSSFFLGLYDPDIVLRVSAPALDSGVYHGAEAVERFYRQFFATFGGTYRFETEKAIEVGDSVLVIARATARGRRSGAAVESRSTSFIATIRAERIIRIDQPGSVEEAREILGLPEQDAHADS